MSLFRQFVDIGQPAPPVARPRPAVTESLRAQIALVAPEPVKQVAEPVKQVVLNIAPPVKQVEVLNVDPTVKQPGNASTTSWRKPGSVLVKPGGHKPAFRRRHGPQKPCLGPNTGTQLPEQH
jgi:hypothetical protein